MTTKKQISKEQQDREYYERNKGVFDYFFEQHLPISILTGGSDYSVQKSDFKRMLNLAGKYDIEMYIRILEHNEFLENLYEEQLDGIIEILSKDAEILKNDPTSVNKVVYLINYHDLVGFSNDGFRRIVKVRYPETPVADVVITDYNNNKNNPQGKKFIARAFDERGNLKFWGKDSVKITQSNGKKITEEERIYCIETLVENNIPLLTEAVDSAIKEYAKGNLDGFIAELLERRYINTLGYETSQTPTESTSTSLEIPSEEEYSKPAKEKVIRRRHNRM